jgi:hypothetical protein
LVGIQPNTPVFAVIDAPAGTVHDVTEPQFVTPLMSEYVTT